LNIKEKSIAGFTNKKAAWGCFFISQYCEKTNKWSLLAGGLFKRIECIPIKLVTNGNELRYKAEVILMSINDNISPGLIGSAQVEVNNQNTAIAYGSGGIDVYATPAMIGLMEKAALSSVDPLLPEGLSTVGIKVNIEHVAATPIGGHVRAESKLLEIDGRRLVFYVQVHDEMRLVGRGTHERFIVEIDKFLQRVTNQK